MKNLKKITSLLLTAALIMTTFVGCGSDVSKNYQKAGTDPQTETFSAQNVERTFTVGFDAEYPPYGYMDKDGNYTGFDLELAAELCKRRNWTLVKQPIDWDSKDLELLSGKINCIWNGFTVTGREDKYEWTVPYVDNSIVFVVANNSKIDKKSDLAGKVVTTQAGSSALTALTNEEDNAENLALKDSFKSLEEVPDYNTAFMNLETGLVDAIAVDIGVAQYQLNNRKGKFRILDEELSKEQYAVGFRYGNIKLKEQVEETLFEMYKDGTVMKIAQNYADFNLPDMICLGNYVK